MSDYVMAAPADCQWLTGCQLQPASGIDTCACACELAFLRIACKKVTAPVRGFKRARAGFISLFEIHITCIHVSFCRQMLIQSCVAAGATVGTHKTRHAYGWLAKARPPAGPQDCQSVVLVACKLTVSALISVSELFGNAWHCHAVMS